MFDVLIKNGDVVNGKGIPRVKADVAVRGDSIAAVGDLSAASAEKMIDASGFVVAPGFIDVHSHSDRLILQYPGGESSVGQGITTSVGGQCGSSAGPLNKYINLSMWGETWREKVAPSKYYPEVAVDLEKVKRAAMEIDGFDINWTTFGQWMDKVEEAKPGINVVPLVGHGAIRTAAMGVNYKRHATADEINVMKRHAAEAMDNGAAGISNGMDYPPGVFCAQDENYAVIGEVTRRGGIFSSHWRRTGLRQGFGNAGLVEGLKEAIDVAKKVGGRFEIAHLSSGYLISPQPTPRLAVVAAEETLGVVQQALDDGVDLSFDVIPNHLTGGTTHQRYLAGTLAPWLKEAGSFEQFAHNLRAPDLRVEIRQYIVSGRWYTLNPNLQPNWAQGIVVTKSTLDKYDGKSIAQIAGEQGKDPLDALMDVISEDPRAGGGSKRPFATDGALRVFYQHPLAMVGCDTLVVDETFESKVLPYNLPNLNTFGGMARFIRLYANGLLGLEEGIRRLTSLPASRLGLADRGAIEVGKKADLVVFKPEAIKECQDDIETRRYPEGYGWVFVNGVAAMENGKLTHSRSGKVLRKR